MGRDLNVACMDCGKRYYIGHGPGITSPEHHKTVAALDAELAKYGVNRPGGRYRAWRIFLDEHEGHRFVDWSTDYCYIDDAGDLRLDYDDDMVEPGVGRLPFIDLDQTRRREEP